MKNLFGSGKFGWWMVISFGARTKLLAENPEVSTGEDPTDKRMAFMGRYKPYATKHPYVIERVLIQRDGWPSATQHILYCRTEKELYKYIKYRFM